MSKVMSESKKKEILRSYIETDMHKELKILFENIFEKDTNVYYTHGKEEYGRDLIISENRPLQKYNTACVVKMDKLSGKTVDKNISDIVVQVKQCFKVELNVKEEVEKLKTDFVYIIIFGEISNQAMTNLKIQIDEFEGRYKIFDITELTNLFSKHYMGVFSGASCYEALSRKFDDLDNILLKKNKLLTSSYIEPNLKSYQKSLEELIAFTTPSAQKRNNEAIAENIFGKKESIQSLLSKIENHNLNILVDGDAGSGKSVFAIKLVQYMIKKVVNEISTIKKGNIQKNVKAPILLTATSLKNGNIKNLNKMINDYYIDASFIIEPSLLIIDGLDEVAKIDRENILTEVKAFSKDKCSLIITSRKSADIKNLLQSFIQYELLEFESSQVINFIKAILKGNDTLINSLIKGIEHLKNQIPMYPMSLSLLIEIAQTQKEVPASISELYSRYIELVIGEKSSENDSIHILFEPKVKIDFLNNIAFKLFYLNNSVSIKRDIFDNFLVQYVNEHSHIKSEEDFLHEISRLSILVIDESEVKFLHKSFLDYFIAKYFIHEFDEIPSEIHNQIYTNFYSSLWEDVTNFYFGIKSKISKIQIDKILEASPRKNNTLNNFKMVNSISCDIQDVKNLELINSLCIFQLSKLMQYAWNTKNEDKEYALNISTLESLSLKEKLMQFQNDEIGMKLPSITADVSMLHFTDLFYSSVFLEHEIEKLLLETIDNLSIISGDEFVNDEMYKSKFYFCNLYVLINANRLSHVSLEHFIKILIKEEEKIPPQLSMVVFGLFSLFKNNKSLKINQDEIDKISLIAKKLMKKYNSLASEIFQFKNKIIRNKLNNLLK